MESSTPLSKLLTRLTSLVRRPTPTDHLLRSRNARLIVQDEAGRSFHVVRLTSRCDVVAAGTPIRLRVKVIADRMVRVSVENKNTKVRFIDVTAPIELGADTMYLNYGDIHLRIEVDAVHPDEN
jgi:hypothetical protein